MDGDIDRFNLSINNFNNFSQSIFLKLRKYMVKYSKNEEIIFNEEDFELVNEMINNKQQGNLLK